ncbi:hypothetical protein [Streptomyces sp. NPDC005125]
MLPESSEFGGGELAVPMGWMHAQLLADQIMRAAQLFVPGSLEFRAARDGLALTAFLTCVSHDLLDLMTEDRRQRWLELTADENPWFMWVTDRLERRMARDFMTGCTDPDLPVVRRAWRWLRETHLLPPRVPADQGLIRLGTVRADPWMPAWQVGLTAGHLALSY